jgi:2-dehydropantoate 2-reductase
VQNIKSIAIIGTGALGGYYGARMAHSGYDVHFLLHSDYEHVVEHGLQVHSIYGDFSISKPNVYAQIQDMPTCDLVCIATKSTSNHVVIPLLSTVLHSDSVLLVLQNGLGTEEYVQSLYPNHLVAGGLCFLCSNKTGPGTIEHLDYGAVRLACHLNDTMKQNIQSVLQKTSQMQMQNIEKVFGDAGLPVQIIPNLLLARWQKLVWNIPFNGLCVVLNSLTDVLMQKESSFQLVQALMQETIDAANACGVHIPKEFKQKMLQDTQKMKPYEPSMLLDYRNQRPMELDTIYKAPILHAQKYGFDMVLTKMLWQQLQFIQSQQ